MNETSAQTDSQANTSNGPLGGVDTSNAYLRTKVMTASPEELRLMLLDGAIRFANSYSAIVFVGWGLRVLVGWG